MKQLLLSIGILFAIASSGVAQSGGAQLPPTPKAAKSDATMVKIRQIDDLIQLLPLNLKKAQIDSILVALEKVRDKQQKIRMLEDDDLEKLDPEISETYKQATEKGAYPNRELQSKIAATMRAMSIRRSVALGEMVDEFYVATKSVFEPGQRTVMAKSLAVAALDPTLKVDKMDEEAKVKFFIRQIFLDVHAYPALIEIRKVAP